MTQAKAAAKAAYWQTLSGAQPVATRVWRAFVCGVSMGIGGVVIFGACFPC